MIIDRQGDLLVITDTLSSLRQQWFAAAFCLALAGLVQIAHRGSTSSLVFSAFAGAGSVVFACIPWRRTEIDRKQHELRISNWWPWGWSQPHIIKFDDIRGVDVYASTGGDGPDRHLPQLLLKSGRPKRLSASCHSPADAENVARAVRHAIFGAS